MLFFKNLQNTFLSLLRIIYFSKFNAKKHIPVNPDDSIIILGNGPSLNLSVEKYKAELMVRNTMAVNLLVCSPLFEELKPAYYTLLAPQFFKNDNELTELYIKNNEQLFSNLIKKTTWEMTLFVPSLFKKSIRLQKLMHENKNIKIQFFNVTPIEGFAFFCHSCFSRGIGMPRPHNVLIPSIMNSISTGFKTIYILGADHSWLKEITVDENNLALVHQKHFYDENESRPEKMQDYIKRPRHVHEIIHKFYLSFKGYWEIKHYAESKNISIFNASEFSMIDAFERRKLS